MAREDIILSERIDRNQTKHQEVETDCDRCGGKGCSARWRYTGNLCYKCGGRGRMVEKRKIYTPEHAEKLKRQRERRAEKKRLAYIEERKEKIPEINSKKLNEWGFQNLKIYVVLGNTYKYKDELREAGAKYKDVLTWYFSERPSKWETTEIDVMELIAVDEYGEFSLKSVEELRGIVNGKREIKEWVSEYVGEVGETVEKVLEFEKSFTFSNDFGYVTINRLRDDKGNLFVWKTQRDLEDDVNEDNQVYLRGKIKEHTEYNEEKQTVLTRCKVIKK
ncbi:hypothetical protein B4086_5728 [Bacillus cereus]|nr:hypothetical protein B4086_5728 [Bacillus cereus]